MLVESSLLDAVSKHELQALLVPSSAMYPAHPPLLQTASVPGVHSRWALHIQTKWNLLVLSLS